MRTRVALVALIALLASASPAAADDAVQLVTNSGDATGVEPAFGASADGSTYDFATTESIPGTGDTDGLNDLYRAEDGKFTLLTGSNPAASGGKDAEYRGTSDDGKRVLFETTENIPGTGDTDNLRDVYEAADGKITLLTGSNPAASGGKDATFVRATADGSAVFFITSENFPAFGDTDDLVDIYRYTTGGFMNLMTNSNPAPNGKDVAFVGNTPDGSRVFFKSAENVPGTADTDGLIDIYRSDGPFSAMKLITSNNPAASGGTEPNYVGNVSNGDIVYFSTAENVPNTGDTDNLVDGYARIAAPGFDAFFLLTGSNPAATGGFDASIRPPAPDGTLFFTTIENIAGSGDTDDLADLYLIRAGQTTLLTGSNPPATGGAPVLTFGGGATSDLSRIYFLTVENIPGTGDTDGLADFYSVDQSGKMALVSGSNPAASGGKEPTGVPVAPRRNPSLDGGRFFFQSEENIPGTGDTDGLNDVFRAEGGKITLMSGSNPAGSGGQPAFFMDASADGSRAFFITSERIPDTGDGDDGADIYQFGPAPPPAPSGGGGNPTGVETNGGGGAATGASGSSAGAGLADLDPAAVTAFRTQRSRFAAAGRGGSIARTKPKVGTKVSYTLSEDATVRFTVERRGAGRRRGGSCRRLTRKNRKAAKCNLLLAGSFTHEGHAGTNSFTFTGRLNNRKLPAGRHNLVATATDRAGNTSPPVRARFTIVR